MPAAIGILLVAIAWFAICLVTFTPESMGGKIGTFMVTDSEDEYAALTNQAFAIAHASTEGESVTILGASTIRETLAEHRRLIIGRYREDLSALARRLSQSVERVGINAEVIERVTQYDAMFPQRYDPLSYVDLRPSAFGWLPKALL